MKLYGVGKSRSFRVAWALEEAGCDFDYIHINFGSVEENGSHSPEYLKLNPQGKVPTLADGDTVVTESGAILNYIARKCADKGLIPLDDPALHARYDEICFYILSELEQALWTNSKHRFAIPKERRVAEVLKTAEWEFNKAADALGHFFDGTGFAVGEQFTMVDILLAHTVTWAEAFGFEVPQKYIEYRNRMAERPAYLRAAKRLEAESS